MWLLVKAVVKLCWGLRRQMAQTSGTSDSSDGLMCLCLCPRVLCVGTYVGSY